MDDRVGDDASFIRPPPRPVQRDQTLRTVNGSAPAPAASGTWLRRRSASAIQASRAALWCCCRVATASAPLWPNVGTFACAEEFWGRALSEAFSFALTAPFEHPLVNGAAFLTDECFATEPVGSQMARATRTLRSKTGRCALGAASLKSSAAQFQLMRASQTIRRMDFGGSEFRNLAAREENRAA